MATVDEALTGRTQLGAALKAGIDTLSLNQKITFNLYVRFVFPADGYVFWLRADVISQSALLNAQRLNNVHLNQAQTISLPATQLIAPGSLHYATDVKQEEASSFAVNRVVFTSEKPVDDLNAIGPELLYIAEFDGIRFAFNGRGSWYKQADTWHYYGNAVYSTMATQVVDDPRTFVPSLIASNSLPAWLALNQYAPVYPVPLPQPAFTLYPSFLIPDNMPPIYGAVHVDPNGTSTLQKIPLLGSTLSHSALTHDRVTVTLYGVSNDLAMTFLDSVLQYSLDTDNFGIMDVSPVLDDKEVQSELGVLAQRKRIVFDVSYYQSSIRNLSRQLILSCLVEYHPEPNPFRLIVDAPITIIP